MQPEYNIVLQPFKFQGTQGVDAKISRWMGHEDYAVQLSFKSKMTHYLTRK